MTAARLIWFAFRNIFVDFGQTIRIFALPALMLALIGAVTLGVIMSTPRIQETLIIIPVLLAAAFCALWPTVNFHRHVLLGERFGWLPRIWWREMLGYGVMMIPLWLLTIALSFLLMAAASQIVAMTMGQVPPIMAFVVTGLLAGTLVTAVGLRLLSLLPGLAIGASLTGYSPGARRSLPTILMIALLLCLANVGYALAQVALMPRLYVALQTGITAVFAVQLLIDALSLVFGISLLTVLYARYVQGRTDLLPVSGRIPRGI